MLSRSAASWHVVAEERRTMTRIMQVDCSRNKHAWDCAACS